MPNEKAPLVCRRIDAPRKLSRTHSTQMQIVEHQRKVLQVSSKPVKTWDNKLIATANLGEQVLPHRPHPLGNGSMLDEDEVGIASNS